ncbi:MAG: hypothetical protein IJ086_13585 [Clostridium sp.]|nr:hypothetical protein [Clostridium sp.]
MENQGRDIIRKVVEAFINSYKLEDFNSLPENIINYLIDIELYFQYCEDSFKNIKSQFKKINLSYRGISSGSNVSWSTFNRYDIFKIYITSRVNDLECNCELVPSNKISSLKEKNKQLETELNEIVNTSLVIGLLKDEIKSLEIQNKNLIIEKNIWFSEKQELYKKLSKTDSKSNIALTDINHYKQSKKQ